MISKLFCVAAWIYVLIVSIRSTDIPYLKIIITLSILDIILML